MRPDSSWMKGLSNHHIFFWFCTFLCTDDNNNSIVRFYLAGLHRIWRVPLRLSHSWRISARLVKSSIPSRGVSSQLILPSCVLPHFLPRVSLGHSRPSLRPNAFALCWSLDQSRVYKSGVSVWQRSLFLMCRFITLKYLVPFLYRAFSIRVVDLRQLRTIVWFASPQKALAHE